MTARFSVGQRVRVACRDLSDSPRKPHVRTPRYVRGKTGTVERICGRFRNPENLAYGGDGLPRRTLYRVRFDQTRIWDDYDGGAADKAEVEIYEHWLEAAPEDGR